MCPQPQKHNFTLGWKAPYVLEPNGPDGVTGGAPDGGPDEPGPVTGDIPAYGSPNCKAIIA